MKSPSAFVCFLTAAQLTIPARRSNSEFSGCRRPPELDVETALSA
jgi:hypothetical protein